MDFPASIKTKRITHPSPNVIVYYPIINNLKNHVAQLKINRAIIATMNKLLIEQNFLENNLVEMDASFEIKNNQRGILSLNLIVYSFTGGAHGMTIIKSMTFDTTTGKQYTLNDLFKKGSNYEEKLSSIIGEDIKKWGIQLLGKFDGIRGDQDFYIADTSIIIYFQLYEITPYVWGFPYFPIPILDIQDIITQDGPLNRMMSFT